MSSWQSDPWGHEVGEDPAAILDATGHMRHHGDDDAAHLLGAPKPVRPGVESALRIGRVLLGIALLAGLALLVWWFLSERGLV